MRRSTYTYLALVTHVGITMVAPILLGIVGGGFLDTRLGRGPLFLFLCTLLGVAAGFRNTYYLLMRNLDR